MRDLPILSKIRYALSEILENGSERYWWRDRFIKRIVGPIQQCIHRDEAMMNPFDGKQKYTDWDILVILDACRADLFEETFPKSNLELSFYESVTSAGSATPEWTRNLLTGKSHGDIVYLTANPWAAKLAPEAFHERIDLWHTEFDDELGTVHPETVTEAAQTARERFPNKRLVLHFMQPHVPFIGAQRWKGSRMEPNNILNSDIEDNGRYGEFGRLRYGDIGREDLWTDYRATLKLALDKIRDLRTNITGRMVLTADHGNMFGERAWPFPIRVYGHPAGLRSSPLLTVPWAVSKSTSDRPRICDDGTVYIPPPGQEEVSVSDRLYALGYTP